MTTDQPKQSAADAPAPTPPDAEALRPAGSGGVPSSGAPSSGAHAAGAVQRSADLPAGKAPTNVTAGDAPTEITASAAPAKVQPVTPTPVTKVQAAGATPVTEVQRAAAEASPPTAVQPAAADEPAAAAPATGWRRLFRIGKRAPARELARVGAAVGSEGVIAPVPSGPMPSGPMPSEPVPSDPAPSNPAPSNPMPSGAAAPPGTRPPEVSGSVPGGEIAPQETSPTVKLKEPLPSSRPADAPPDPWTAFATTPERGPGRIRRATRAFGRALIHEYALVTYIAIALAVGMTWPTLQYPLHTLPQDLGDPARQAWQIAWSGHILLTDPVKLWQSNAYFPQPNSFAYGDSLLGYAPAGMIGTGPLAAVLRYNILFVLAHALLLIGAYALVRQLGAGRTGAAVAAVAFAYAPWRLAQEGHLDIISAGGIPLALAMIARGHGWSLRRGFRRGRRHAGWAAAGWIVAAWQVSLGFSLGLPFLGVLGLILLVLLVRVPIRWWRRPAERPVLGWRLMTADIIGPLIVAGAAAVIALPYLKTGNTVTATAEIKFFSPPLRSLLIGPAESRLWGGPHQVPRSSLPWPAEMSLLPGFVLYALALAGLAFSIWTLWQRLFLLAGLAATTILALGTNFFDGRWTYLPLFGHLPASLGTRIPGRLMLWVTLLLAILAAGAVAEFVRRADHWAELRIPPWPGPWLRSATLVPLVLVLLEGWNATAHPVVPAQPTAMRTVTGPMLVLPTADTTDQMVMLWSTTRFQQIANGSGGFAAAHQAIMRRTVESFPDSTSIEYLRSQGVTTVLLLRDYVAGTPWERAGDVPVDSLGISREDLDDAVLFRLTQPATQPTNPAQPGQPGAVTPTQPGTLPGTGTDPGTGTLPGTGTDPGTGTLPGTGTDPGGSLPGTGTQLGTGTQPGTGIQPGAGVPGDPNQPVAPGQQREVPNLVAQPTQ